MPRFDPHPRFGVLSQVDLRLLADTLVFGRNGGGLVTLPDFALDEGIFLDPFDALCGHGSDPLRSWSADLKAGIAAAGGLASDIDIALNADDRFEITWADPGGTITITPSAGNVWWGWPAAGAGPFGPGPTTITAPMEWRRGMFTNGTDAPPPRLGMSLDGGGTFEVPLSPAWVQDMRIGQRERGNLGDLDDQRPLQCIEAIDNDANDPVNRRIRWGVTDDNHVFWSAPVGLASGVDPIVWQNDTFRDRLGFDGTEGVGATGLTADDVTYQIANREMPGNIQPTRPWKLATRFTEIDTREAVLLDRRRFRILLGDFTGWDIDFWIDGPGDRKDVHQAWIEETARLLATGACTLVMDWGDSRRSRRLGQYSDLYTVELEGYRGRRRVYFDAPKRLAVRWKEGLMRRAPASITLFDAEDDV